MDKGMPISPSWTRGPLWGPLDRPKLVASVLKRKEGEKKSEAMLERLNLPSLALKMEEEVASQGVVENSKIDFHLEPPNKNAGILT